MILDMKVKLIPIFYKKMVNNPHNCWSLSSNCHHTVRTLTRKRKYYQCV